MKKTLLTLILFSVFLAFPLSAQEKTEKSLSLESLFSSLSDFPVTSGNFIQTKTSPKLKRPLQSWGKFIFCEQGILWKTEKPFPSSTILTKSSITKILPDGSKNVTDGSSNPVFESVSQTVSSIFSGSKESLETFFTISDFKSTQNQWILTLTPKDANIALAIQKIELSGEVKENSSANFQSLNSMEIFQKEGESTKYSLKDKSFRQELTDDEKKLFQ